MNGAHRAAPGHDLKVAELLAAAGVPVFLARPARDSTGWDPAGGTGRSGYWLPRGWERTEADPAVVHAWAPGLAVAAVMGVVVDGLDVDPRNGGSDSLASLSVPRTYGVQATPSGGWHGLIAPLRVGSRDAVRPGIDIKGGRPDGTGRGFLWIAPTVKLSKATGGIAAYRWLRTPDLTGIRDDTSGAALAAVIEDLRSSVASTAATFIRSGLTAVQARILLGLVDTVLRAQEGERNSTLHWAGCRAAEHAAAGRLDWAAAEVGLTEAGELIGLDQREIAATLRSAQNGTTAS